MASRSFESSAALPAVDEGVSDGTDAAAVTDGAVISDETLAAGLAAIIGGMTAAAAADETGLNRSAGTSDSDDSGPSGSGSSAHICSGGANPGMSTEILNCDAEVSNEDSIPEDDADG